MWASAANKLNVKVDWDRADKVTVVSLYPHEITLEVPRNLDHKDLFDKIREAFVELYAARNEQY